MITDEQVQAEIDDVTEGMEDITTSSPRLLLIKSLVHALVGRGLDVDSAERLIAAEYESFGIKARDFDVDNPLHQKLVSLHAEFFMKAYLTMEEAGIQDPLHFLAPSGS